jgi:hypothetical protein
MLPLCSSQTLQLMNVENLLPLVQPCFAYIFLSLSLDALFRLKCEYFELEHLPLSHEIYS